MLLRVVFSMSMTEDLRLNPAAHVAACRVQHVHEGVHEVADQLDGRQAPGAVTFQAVTLVIPGQLIPAATSKKVTRSADFKVVSVWHYLGRF